MSRWCEDDLSLDCIAYGVVFGRYICWWYVLMFVESTPSIHHSHRNILAVQLLSSCWSTPLKVGCWHYLWPMCCLLLVVVFITIVLVVIPPIYISHRLNWYNIIIIYIYPPHRRNSKTPQSCVCVLFKCWFVYHLAVIIH